MVKVVIFQGIHLHETVHPTFSLQWDSPFSCSKIYELSTVLHKGRLFIGASILDPLLAVQFKPMLKFWVFEWFSKTMMSNFEHANGSSSNACDRYAPQIYQNHASFQHLINVSESTVYNDFTSSFPFPLSSTFTKCKKYRTEIYFVTQKI